MKITKREIQVKLLSERKQRRLPKERVRIGGVETGEDTFKVEEMKQKEIPTEGIIWTKPCPPPITVL